jgi:lipopolysaccharide export system permease protein
VKRIDKLVLSELIGPWLFGVAIFTVLIMAGTYLFKLTDYIVSGVSPSLLIEFTFLILPGVMVKTFSMAVLLATLLAFGRLSSDSEIVAVRAAGASIYRLMVPVAVFAFGVAILAFATNEKLVSYAAMRGAELKDQIEKGIKGGRQPTFVPVFVAGKLKALIMAKDFNLEKRTLTGATVKAFDDQGKPTAILDANELKYESDNRWSVSGGRIFSYSGTEVIDIGKTYPLDKFADPPKPEDILATNLKDLDTFSMAQMRTRIAAAKQNPAFDKGQIANLEYGYYNKISLPLATVIFGLLGAPLGIRNHRTGAAVGFWLSVIIIFSYMMLANLMNIYAMGAVIPSYVASFSPLAVGLVLGIVFMYRRNL